MATVIGSVDLSRTFAGGLLSASKAKTTPLCANAAITGGKALISLVLQSTG